MAFLCSRSVNSSDEHNPCLLFTASYTIDEVRISVSNKHPHAYRTVTVSFCENYIYTESVQPDSTITTVLLDEIKKGQKISAYIDRIDDKPMIVTLQGKRRARLRDFLTSVVGTTLLVALLTSLVNHFLPTILKAIMGMG